MVNITVPVQPRTSSTPTWPTTPWWRRQRLPTCRAAPSATTPSPPAQDVTPSSLSSPPIVILAHRNLDDYMLIRINHLDSSTMTDHLPTARGSFFPGNNHQCGLLLLMTGYTVQNFFLQFNHGIAMSGDVGELWDHFGITLGSPWDHSVINLRSLCD